MTVYLDSTYVIRRLLSVGQASEFWAKWDKAYASVLMRTECFRAANLLRLNGKLDDAGRARLGAWIETVCSTVVQLPVTDEIMRRASGSFPVSIGTLQAIHLATMQELESVHGVRCAIASSDEGLVQAAKALGFSAAEDAPIAAGKKDDDARTSDAK